MKTVPKNIKQYSEVLTLEQVEEFHLLQSRYHTVRQYVFSRFGSIGGLKYLDSFRSIRNEWTRTKFFDQWDLPQNYRKAALQDALESLKASWEAAKIPMRKAISKRKDLNPTEKHYCQYVLKVNTLCHKVTHHSDFPCPAVITKETKNKKVYPIDFKKVHSFLNRTIRKYKFGAPTARSDASMRLDENLYTYTTKKNKSYTVGIAGLFPRKRILLKMKDKRVLKGDLRLILEENRLVLHRCTQVPTQPFSSLEERVIGVDKGYKTLMVASTSDVSQAIFGKEAGSLFTKNSHRITETNKKRNKLRSLAKKYQERGFLQKASRIRKHNLGKKKYWKRKNQETATEHSFINRTLNTLIQTLRPSKIFVEDLTWTKKKHEKSATNYSKTSKRLLSSWKKGVLHERLAYKCALHQIECVLVNAAYTSQICHKCGRFGDRTGQSFTCSLHGVFDADYNGSVNVKDRGNDPDITLFTPKEQVKRILLSRILDPTEVRRSDSLCESDPRPLQDSRKCA